MRLKYVLSEVAVGLWRNVTMTVAMIITMAVSLTLLGASVLLYFQVDKMRAVYYEQVEVTIFLKTQETTEAQKEAIKADLANDPLVALERTTASRSKRGRADTRHRCAGLRMPFRVVAAGIALFATFGALGARAQAARPPQADLARVEQILLIHILHLPTELMILSDQVDLPIGQQSGDIEIG